MSKLTFFRLLGICFIVNISAVRAQDKSDVVKQIVQDELAMYRSMEAENAKPNGARFNVPKYDSLSIAFKVVFEKEKFDEYLTSLNDLLSDDKANVASLRVRKFDSLFKSGYWSALRVDYSINNGKIDVRSILVCGDHIGNYRLYFSALEKKGRVGALSAMHSGGKFNIGGERCGVMASYDPGQESGLKSAAEYLAEIKDFYKDNSGKLHPPFATFADYSAWEKKNNVPPSDYRLTVLRKQFLLHIAN